MRRRARSRRGSSSARRGWRWSNTPIRPYRGSDETLARLGPPDLVLADRRFVADATVRDHVYARRGLAVSIAEPFTDAPGHERRAVHLQLFAPTSPETYLTEIDRGDELAPKTHPRQEADRP